MQWFTLAFAAMAFCAVSVARTLPNGLVFYQSAPVYYKRSAPLTQRMMYVQYLPQHANRRSATAGGVSAFASGDTIATGTYLRDCNRHTEGDYGTPDRNVEYQPHEQDVQLSNGGATSVAEAYPEQTPLNTEQLESEQPDFQLDPLKVDLPQEQPSISYAPEIPEVPDIPEVSEIPETATEYIVLQKKEKKPKELVPQEENIDPEPTSADEPSEDPPSTNEVETPIVAVPVPSYIQPKKKIRVELEAPESIEYENEHPYYIPHFPKKTKGLSSTKQPSAALPPGTFFPIDFGGATGGAIAIANSFSTGEGGSASSTATAYGNPAETRFRAKKRLVHE